MNPLARWSFKSLTAWALVWMALAFGAHGGSGTTLKDVTAATPVVFGEAAAVTACNNNSNTIVLTST